MSELREKHWSEPSIHGCFFPTGISNLLICSLGSRVEGEKVVAQESLEEWGTRPECRAAESEGLRF